MEPSMQEVKVMSARNPRHVLYGVLLMLLAAAVIAGGLYYYFVKTRIVTAPAGNIVKGFPNELIVEPGAYVVNSYKVEYGAGTSQPVLSYLSNKKLDENIAAFRVLMAKEGWQIMRESDPASPIYFLYAVKGKASLNVTMSIENGVGVKIVEAYATGD